MASKSIPAPPVSELAVAEGRRMARRVFEKRGNHTEAHIREDELAALLAIAFERGELKAARAQ